MGGNMKHKIKNIGAKEFNESCMTKKSKKLNQSRFALGFRAVVEGKMGWLFDFANCKNQVAKARG